MDVETLKESFVDNGDQTVTSKEHGLMWVKTDSMNDLKKWVNYQDSVDYVRGLNEKKFAGYEDWRLPTRDEMPTLFNKAKSANTKNRPCHQRKYGFMKKLLGKHAIEEYKPAHECNCKQRSTKIKQLIKLALNNHQRR